MKIGSVLMCGLLFVVGISLVTAGAVCAADPPKSPVTIKIEGAKMAPVTFSHETHVTKGKVECVKCHHKDAQAPKACTTCHEKEMKDKTPAAKDVFHKLCQGCHKEKGGAAPTKCGDCHKK
jgi:hypothetical protein